MHSNDYYITFSQDFKFIRQKEQIACITRKMHLKCLHTYYIENKNQRTIHKHLYLQGVSFQIEEPYVKKRHSHFQDRTQTINHS